MIIDCVSDLHGEFPELPGGDLLIVAGDLTASDQPDQYQAFCHWLWNQSYTGIVFIGGNHDNKIDYISKPKTSSIQYLCDSGTEFCGLKIWGSPWSLRFNGMNPHCMAFTGTEEDLESKFKLIPDDTDILVTHSPPWGIMDEVKRSVICFPKGSVYSPENCGSHSLRTHVERVKPQLHVFGHIHQGYGQVLLKHEGPNTMCVNASIMDECYKPRYQPIRIIL